MESFVYGIIGGLFVTMVLDPAIKEINLIIHKKKLNKSAIEIFHKPFDELNLEQRRAVIYKNIK